ncbi:MAG: thiolase [Dehalococcoidia bacterium]|uniref:Thiolase C-terminal domain-containing protein n=1 Tax=marine metagenome TaxID=408172 RepID=A0A381NE57_9ZZZZ|nr:thiolase [Dehalococcoidia bacterium]MCH2314001.1 thiolase [SAR202 cluster bacterium]MCS5649456.1 thiolase [Dehalococcoidia bacterium]MEC7914201.1 thiolase [Chloroflexota bacterium]HBF00567.1 thiolase [Dehalococcoidia bacterium]|tara:strand:+ start:4578 stop:5759 length:1182 start_codon:yes stop_codon:yes gene_type:complete
MDSLRYKAAIVGASETTELGSIPDKTAFQLHVDASVNAINDCGIDKNEIDGIATTMSPAALAHYLGIIPTWIDNTQVGGTSFLVHVRHAAAAIASGLCETVLVAMAESGRNRVGEQTGRIGDVASMSGGRRDSSFPGQFESIYGVAGPTTQFGMGVLRYMKETGLTHEQLASVPVAQRKWANKVPRAMYRDIITIEDVFNSRMICYPFHLLECCLVTDGGGALIITSAERAKDFPTKPVYIMGTGESVESPVVSQMYDMTTSAAFKTSSKKAFEEAGVTQDDVDHLMVYDAFAHLPIYGLEDLGFVKRGEAGSFIEEGNTSPGGKLPMNTNGGGLSYTHSGMYGMYAIQESVRQVRGEAAHQVDGVKTSFCQGVGGMFMAAGSLVFTNEGPHR